MEKTTILVWDLPLRVFHWLLVGSFVGAFLTAEGKRYQELHVTLGYMFVGLLAFRLLWAFVGTRYARLSSFAFGPTAVVSYLKSLFARKPLHYVGHNPAGSWVIYALVLFGLAVGASGYAVYEEAGGHWLKELHEGLANAMLGLVIAHVAGVIVSSLVHRENLVLAMLTGRKRGPADAAIGRNRWPTAVALVLAVAVLWASAPLLQSPVGELDATAHGRAHAPAHEESERRERHES